MASKISINLDTSKENYLVAKCKQNDDLVLEALIYENGLALDLTNKTITVQALKADGTYIIQSTGITKTNNKVTVNLIRDFSRVPGTTKIEMVLIESGKQNTTFSFYLEVVNSVIKGAVESTNTVTILEELENKIVEAGAVKEETEHLITSGNAATKGDVAQINASLEQIATGVITEIFADIDSTSFKSGRKVDIETLRQTQNKNFFNFMKKIRNRERLKIICQGDSLTYGSDVTSTDRKPSSDVINSDGSKSGVTRASITYPEALENYLNQVYRSTVNPKLVTVETRAYPGDWCSKSYERHYKKHTGDINIIMLGTNDSRRSDYEDVGNVEVYYYWLEQIIIRELLWDKAVVLLTPPKTQNLDIDVDAFANAVHGLGKKYNIPIIDSDEFTSQYPADIYSDATHFNGTGYSIFGSRVASVLVGEGAHKPKYVLAGTVLLTRRTLDNVNLIWNASYSGSTSSYAPAPNEIEADKSLNVMLSADNGEIIYSFYALNENLIVIPNMFVSSNAVVTVELDFGVPQAQNALDSVIGVYAINETVSNKLNITYPTSTWIHKKHYLDNLLEPLRITQKGWHTIRIKTTVTSTAFYGLEFLSFQEWDNAKKIKTLMT